MATKPKDDTKAESPAEMEARIRREVEAQVRSETEQRMRAEIEAQVRAVTSALPVKQTRLQAAQELAAFQKTLPEVPRYQLKDKFYFNDQLYDPELKPWIPHSDPAEREPLIVAYPGRPGPYMVPKNKAAEMMWAKYPPADSDPIAELSIVGEEGSEALKKATTLA